MNARVEGLLAALLLMFIVVYCMKEFFFKDIKNESEGEVNPKWVSKVIRRLLKRNVLVIFCILLIFIGVLARGKIKLGDYSFFNNAKMGKDSDIADNDSDTTEKKQLDKKIKRLQNFIGNEEYKKGIEYYEVLEDDVSNEETVLELYEECKIGFRMQKVSKAKEAYQNSGYQAAIDIIKEGLEILPDDDVLNDEYEKYEEYEPVLLSEMDTFYSDYEDWSNGGKENIQSVKDKLGKTHENCIVYWYGYEDSKDIYVLDKKYSKFTGTIFVPDSRQSKIDDWYHDDPYYFSIYGDDKLLYKSPKMISTQYPVDFSIDISGVDQLKINWNGGACTWDYEIGLSNAYISK